MSAERRRLPFTGSPSREPGQGEIELEAMAGDIQLTPPLLSRWRRRAGRARATQHRREALHKPTEKAPVSGVYDLVDDRGNYLSSQVTCHEGEDFPVTNNHFARELDELCEETDEKGRKTQRIVHHYRYRLAYEALHLGPPPARDETIHLPGEVIPTSGVYDVVDLDGTYLLQQRACVHSKTGDPKTRSRFPETEGPEPGAYGYRLAYPAEHLSD